ncbi:MAG: metalloregulator ArsR/SmtB family transcription factor, partial [Gallionella sp.]
MMKSGQVVKALAALAQSTRLAIYRVLVERGPAGMAAGQVAEKLKVAPATMSFHLKTLSHAGLIESRQEGRFI